MPKTSYADVALEVDPAQPQREPLTEKPDRDRPFRILVLGDFSGKGSRGEVVMGVRKPIAIDRDNFDAVLESLKVTLRLELEGGAALDIPFHELDDFTPDRLFDRLPVFRKLRELRRQLEDPETFLPAAQQLGVVSGRATPAAAPPASPPVESVLSGSLLEQALEATESRGAAPARQRDPLAQYVHTLVAPHLVPKPDPKKKEILQQVDEATAAAMRALLHQPRFQQLESNWRALHLLVRELETGPLLKVYLADISREELEADLIPADDLRATGLYKLLVEQTVRTPGAHPWTVLVGCYSFGPDMSDLNLLGRLGLLARQATAPLLAGASPRLLGCRSLVETPYPEHWKPGPEQEGWKLIRSLPEARYIGLVLPRFLLRLPYGKQTLAVETFDFEEMPSPPVHEHYLWGNSAFIAAYLLGQSFAESGWQMEAGQLLTLRGLPMHVYKQDGEAKITPCAEVLLSETAMEKVHAQGLMALMSYAGDDRVRLAGFRSVALPEAALSGPWA